MPTVKPETRFYRNVNKLLPNWIHRQKIGAGQTNGTPDFYYSAHGGDLWAEYKWVAKPPKLVRVTKLLSPLQLHWLNGRYREGRNVAVIVGTPSGNQVFVGRTWEGDYSQSVFVLTNAQVAQYISGICTDSNDLSENPCTNCGSG